MSKKLLLIAATLMLGSASSQTLEPKASSGTAPSSTVSSAELPDKLGHIVRVFGQVLRYSASKNFVPVFEDKNRPTSYLLEYVLRGETVDKWSQMITVGGTKDLATVQGFSAERLISGIVGGFQRACPESFSGVNGGALKIDQQDAHIFVASCGTLKDKTGGAYSETTMLIVIKGIKDAYTLQWAERGAAVVDSKGLSQDPKWITRFRDFQPLMLCPVIAGEQMPYPSCLNRTQ